MKLLNHYRVFFIVSLFFLLPGIYSLLKHGLLLGIDFTGGSLLEVKYESNIGPDQLELKQAVEEKNYSLVSIQSSGQNQAIIRTGHIDNQQKDELIQALETKIGKLTVLRFETVGPSLSKELLEKTLVATGLVALIITIYVWRQFKDLKFGVCAVFAMFHDSLILLGSFSLLGVFFKIEVDVLFVTAILTTLSFSIHDTIVVFDRIRELRRQQPRLEMIKLANIAVLETLNRSVNNSVTIILMLLALFLLGGESIRHFALALLIGAVTGTYSSPFVAVPLVLEWDRWKRKIK